ncbi:MAG TPA: OB-fold nucleic acid binding domain-containing protein [Candidatus Bathyarchaeia archaeon]|nr:OB-fold nucleic acid binding domain-containing protein [Candidatus Bathyarchaeia archaeon]
MDLENIVQRILLTRRDLTRSEVLRRIYDKKRSSDDYFLDEVAARIVAMELGVEIQSQEEAFPSEIAIKDLVSGLNDVTIVGRVIAVYPVQTFTRKDFKEGKLARLLLTDGTGTLKLVLWDDNVDLVETGKMQQGQIVRVLHAYVRESFDGRLELHLGRKGDLEISPQGIDESRFPHTAEAMDKIAQVTPQKKKTSVQGQVTSVFPISEFTRKDSSSGKVRRLRLKDETGETTLVFWNEKVDELGTVDEGDHLRITNARVKTGLDGRVEVHVENSSQIQKTAGQAARPIAKSETTRRIADLAEGELAIIEAAVTSAPIIKEVTTSRGENVLVASFDLADESGTIGVSLWRKHTEFARELSIGTKIKLKDVYVKKGFLNPLELASRSSTTVEIVSKPATLQPENKLE